MAQHETRLALRPIGHDTDTIAEYREMTWRELAGESFSDYFRFSFTVRIDRDVALALVPKLEAILGRVLNRDVRVYLGVHNNAERRARIS